MPVIAALVAIGGAVLFAGVAISKAIAKIGDIDTEALDASRQVQRQLDRAIPREIVIGHTMTGGVGAFNDAYGPNNEFGVAVTVLSSIPITGFDTLVVDGDRMTLDGDPTTGFRFVTSHYLGYQNAKRMQCRVWLGDNNASLGSWLAATFPSKFTSNDTFEGCAVLVTIAENTNDDIDDDGENHIPFQSFPTVQAIVYGVELCDPRNGGVYGDTSTYAYSNNAGLADAHLDYGFYGGASGDILIVGNGYDVGLLDTAQIGATATYCDARGYTCAGRVRSAAQTDLDEVRKCFNGVRFQSPAAVKTIPQGARPDVITIDMALYPYAQVVDANRQGFSADVYNKFRTLYREPDELFGNKDLPVYFFQDWIDEDNGVPRELDIELKFVTDGAQGFKLQKEIAGISRAAGSATVINLPADFGGDRVLPSGTKIALRNARPAWLNDTLFVMESKRRASNFDVDIALREYAGDDVFLNPGVGEITDPVINPVITRTWTPRVAPTFPPGTSGGIVREIGGVISVTDVQIAGQGSTAAEIRALKGNLETVESGGGVNLAISFSGNANYSGGPSSSATTNAVTGTASGGSGTYSTYLWQFVSGDALTINSPNAATSSFSYNLGPNDFFSSQVSLTVTDDLGDSTTKNLSVTAFDDTIFLY